MIPSYVKKKIKIKSLDYILIIGIICLFIVSMCIFIMKQDRSTHIYVLDVGQGDSIVIKHKKGVFIIDGGGERFREDKDNTGKEVVHPFLLEKGINQVDCIFITHVHYDHIKGILELLKLIKIKEIVLPKVYLDFNKQEKDLALLDAIFQGGDELMLLSELFDLCKSKNIPILYMEEGDVIYDDKLSFSCLYPGINGVYNENENENSLVLLMKVGGFSALFTGDIEKEGESWITGHGEFLQKVDILKIAHHGSNTSSSEEFINRIKPTVGIISYGENLFGHPSELTKMRFRNMNIPLYSTKKCGMIEVIITGDKYKIVPFKGELIDETT